MRQVRCASVSPASPSWIERYRSRHSATASMATPSSTRSATVSATSVSIPGDSRRRLRATARASCRRTVWSQAMNRGVSVTGARESAISIVRWYASSASCRDRV